MAITTTPRAVASDAAAARDQVDGVISAMVTLAGLVAGAGSWPARDRHAMLTRLDRAVDGLSAVRAAVLVAERDAGTWQGAGDRSLEAWLGRTSRAGHRAAAARVRQAEHLAAVPAVVEAVADGRIGLGHAVAIGQVAASGTPAQQAAVTSPEAQAELVELAQALDATTFATSLTRYAATVDPDGLEAAHQAQRRARFLQLTDTPGGTLVKGRLDTMTGHRLRLALEAVTPRPAADDDRDHGQRCADALAELAERTLASDTKPGAHVPPQITMILTEQTWNAARAELERRRARDRAGSGSGSGDAAEERARVADESVVGHPPATLEDGTAVPPSELAVAMCDCAITRLVVDADGVPLDLGRTQRLFTGEQRRAIIARDRECIWPDCHVPARWCHIHHLRYWERDNGPTSVDDGALYCSFHHQESHRRDLTVTRVLAPPGEESSRDGPPGGGPPGEAPPGEGPPGDEPPGCGAPPHGSRPGRGRGRTRRRPAGTIALATYELRDPTGRLIGGQSADQTAGGRGDESAADDGRHRPTDPITGARVPASWVPG
jgi:hypothetical protein